LNPLDWFKFVYEVFGGEKHPAISFIVTVVIFGFIGAIIWRAGYLQHQKQNTAIPQQIRPSVVQTSTDSSCSNVVGESISVNCPTNKGAEGAKANPKAH
jgi:hypothetical protein